VGLESPDWYRGEYRKRRRPPVSRWLIVGLAVGTVLLIAVSPPISDRFGYEPPFGIGRYFGGEISSI